MRERHRFLELYLGCLVTRMAKGRTAQAGLSRQVNKARLPRAVSASSDSFSFLPATRSTFKMPASEVPRALKPPEAVMQGYLLK